MLHCDMTRVSFNNRFARVASFFIVFTLAACGGAATLWGSTTPGADAEFVRMDVKATAYNSTRAQTQGDPFLGACGVRLRPGMKAIAVSRDLFRKTLHCGQKVYIEELGADYLVLDTMAKRWRKKIDIYMGVDIKAARRWGVRDVTIRWSPKDAQ